MEMCYDGALVMPSSYAVMDAEEMTYVEGGVTYTASKCRDLVGKMGLASGQILITIAATAALVSKYVQRILNIGGVVAWIVKAAAGLAITALGKIAYGIGYSAVSGKSVTIEASPAPWDAFVNVSWK